MSRSLLYREGHKPSRKKQIHYETQFPALPVLPADPGISSMLLSQAREGLAANQQVSSWSQWNNEVIQHTQSACLLVSLSIYVFFMVLNTENKSFKHLVATKCGPVVFFLTGKAILGCACLSF